MKKLLSVLALFTATQLLAVNPVPYTEGVGFSFRISGAGSGTMTVYDENGSPSCAASTGGATTESSIQTAWLRSGKQYSVNFQASGPGNYWLSFITPDGYTLYIDGVRTNLIAQSPGGGSYSHDYIIELRPLASAAGRADFAVFSGMDLGKSLTWDVGLGSLWHGDRAGRIIFKEQDFSSSNSPTARARLYADIPANGGEVTIFKDGPSSQTLRQVNVPQGMVDIVDDAGGGYWLKFYTPAQIEWSPGNPAILHGSPWKIIRVESPGTNQLKITETEGSVVRVSLLSLPSGSSPQATGGTVTTSGVYTVHTFNSSGTFAPSTSLTADLLVVAGGGGGGHQHAGGGGAGGLLTVNSLAVSAGSYSITVGAGGAGCTWVPYTGNNGGNSTALGYTAVGGGAGTGADQYGNDGGSGGGDGYPSGGVRGGNGTSGQGNTGSRGSSTSMFNGGGGGGAGGAGSGAYGGAALSTWAGTFAGGGGGGYAGGPGGGAGAGAGGSGGAYGGNATANTGSGGGGGGNMDAYGGNGGSGIVVIRYPTGGTLATGNYSWTLQEGNGSTWLRTTTHTSTNNGNGTRDDIAVVRTGGTSGTIVAKTKYHYVTQAWGEDVTQVIADPDTAALTTTYDYYTTSSAYGNYRRVKSVTAPTGNWTAWEYYDDWDKRGQLKYEYHAFLDSPATVPSTLDPTSGRVVYFEYAADWTGRYTRPTLRQEKINNVVTAKTTWSHGDNTGSGWPREYASINSYRDSTNYHTDYTEHYRADSHPNDAGQPYIQRGANLAQASFSQGMGDFNSGTGAFTYNSAGGSHLRLFKVNGSSSSSGADSQSSALGSQPFPAVFLVPNQSTLETTILTPAGQVLRTETYVYTGNSSYSLMTHEDFTYDDAGRLLTRVKDNNTLLTNTYANGQLTSTVDAAGTETQFTYDILGRVVTSVKKGASAGTYAAQVDITTTNTYDGANHVTQSEVTATSMSALTATAAFDLSGRVTQQVANASASDTSKRFTTGYDYTLSPRKVKVTSPGGAYKTTEVYYDGQVKAVTGSAVVEQFVDYTVNTTPGTITTQVKFGTSTSSNLVKTTNDWLGRAVTEVKPGWNGSDVTTTNYYNSSGQLYKVSRPGLADTLYSYDTLGVLFRECLDVGANGSIDLASTDRITEHGWEYFTSASGVWWQRQKTSTYATDSSGTATQTGKKETQLSGFTAAGSGYTRLSRSDGYDIFGNVVTTYTEVARSSKMAVTTTVAPNSSTNAVQTAYNGLLVSARDITNKTMTYGYDNFGRQTTSVDPRTGTTTTYYLSGTSLIDKIKDPTTGTAVYPATYTYDSAGRVATVTNGLGKVCRYSYTDRNEPYRVWGDTDVPVEYGYDYWGHRTTMKTYRGGSGWTGSSWPGSPGTADVTTWNYQEATGLLAYKEDALTGSSHRVTYTYTQAGQIDVRTWTRGVTTTYGYSSTTGELLTVDYSGSTPDLTYAYNRLGKIKTVVDATGTRTLNYNLGGALQQLSEDLPSFFGSNTRITYGYDTATGVIGRPNALKLGTAFNATAYQSITYGYESSTGRFNSLVGGGVTFGYTYTTNSNLLASIANTSSGWTQSRSYLSNRDLLDVIETKISTTSKAKFDYACDNLGRRTSVAKTSDNTSGMFSRYGNGSQGLDTTWGYDDRSQVTSEVTKLGGTSTVLTGRDDGYAYDTMGNRSSTSGTSHNGNTANYTTNALNQYTQRTVPGVFDVSGAAAAAATVTVNGSSSGVTHGGSYGDYFFKGHALTNTSSAVATTLEISDGTNTDYLYAFLALTPEAFVYDADGNMTSDGRWDYTWDAENRLVSMQTHTALSPSPITNANAQRIEFTYDYLGRRVEKLVRGGYNGTSYTTVPTDEKAVWNGWMIMARFDANNSNALIASHYWGIDLSGSIGGAGAVGSLLMTQAGDNSYLPVYDALGNVHGMIKASDGSLAAAYEYDAFGQTLRESGDYAASNPFRFSTKYTDIETGLVYYGLRYYSPSLGRFINQDPIEEQGGLNLYGFAGNDGVNNYDYLGQSVESCLRSVISLYGEQGNTGMANAGSGDSGAMWASMGTRVDNGGVTVNGAEKWATMQITEALRNAGATPGQAKALAKEISAKGFETTLAGYENAGSLAAHSGDILIDKYPDIAVEAPSSGLSAKDPITVTVTDNGVRKTITLTDNGHIITSPSFPYTTRGMDSAAVSVLSQIGPISGNENIEYAGTIYSPWFSDKLQFTQPLTANLEANSYTRGNTPFLSSVVATYHTHGGNSNGNYLDEYFSGSDLRNAGNNGVPSYLYAPSGNIYKFQPVWGVSKWDPQISTFVPTDWTQNSTTGMYAPKGP